MGKELRRGLRCIAVAAFAAAVCLFPMRRVYAQAGVWTEKVPMPTARGFAAGATAGGKLYVLGGWNPDVAPPTLSIIESYDPKLDAWSHEAAMPVPRIYAGAASLDGIVYIVGGCDPATCYLSSVEAYDPKTTAWTLKAPMPTGRNDLVAAAVDGKLYAIGGATPNGLVATVETYDPTTNAWVERAPCHHRDRILRSRRSVASCTFSAAKIYTAPIRKAEDRARIQPQYGHLDN